MAKYQAGDIRNIALCGHGGAGKTSLVDKILHLTGAVNHIGTVDAGSSFCDFDEEEKLHKYTVEAKITHFDYEGKLFHFVDTPGYPDFIGQTIGALAGVDNALIAVNAASGIEVNTRRVFNEAKKLGMGRMIVLTKLDSDNIKFDDLMEQIRDVFGSECFLMNVPLGIGGKFHGVASVLNPEATDNSDALVDVSAAQEAFFEQAVMADDELMEKFLEGEYPTVEELAVLLPKAVADGTVIPVFCVSTKNNVGLNELLSAMKICAVRPDMITKTATDDKGETVDVTPDPAGPLVAQVFKTRSDPFVQKLSYFRIYSGSIKTGDTVPMIGSRKGIKVAQLISPQAGQAENIEEAGPGYIVALAKADELQTNSTLGNFLMDPIQFPLPMVGLAATPKSRGDEGKLSGALTKLAEEDPTFKREQDTQTKELVITGMSELHLQILRERLKRRDKVEIDTREPKIPYRETIQTKSEGSYRHKKQSGGSGQFGEVHIRMYPFPKDTKPEEYATKDRFPTLKEFHHDPEFNFLWVDTVVGGTIPGNFMPAIEKGFKERMNRGVIAGYRVQDVCVEVHFGKHHPVDSNETAFKTAGSMVFRNVFQQARPSLLEPIVKIEITVPTDKVGDISGDLSTRRGRPVGMESAGGGMQTIIAEIPLAEVTTYARTLSSLTGGQGSYTLEFDRYDVVPGNIVQEIIAKAKMEEEEEE
ncbi:MAG: elongation factor G [Planctomycetia bacterium]|nr:elongation factor G [Planctomycetia bacterium]